MIPDNAHQMPAPIENDVAEGLLLVSGSTLAAPIPTPTRLRISWATSATTTPAKTAPHEIRLIRTVRISSSGRTELECAASLSPRARGVSLVIDTIGLFS